MRDAAREEARAKNLELRCELRLLVVQALRDADVPFAALARLVGVSQTRVDAVFKLDSDADIPLTWVLEVAKRCDAKRAGRGRLLVDDVFRVVGLGFRTVGVLAAVDGACPEVRVLGASARAQRESGELGVALADSLADGHLSTAEKARIKREGGEAVAAIEDVVALATG
jgi:hypothetical protein